MKYTIDKQDKYTTMTLHEEKLDSSIAPSLKSELITLHAEGSRNIILNLEEVKYSDSSGLSALLVGNRVIQEDNGAFVLACLSEHTQKLIKISQLDSVLQIMPTMEEAAEAVLFNEIENDLKNESDN